MKYNMMEVSLVFTSMRSFYKMLEHSVDLYLIIVTIGGHSIVPFYFLGYGTHLNH